MSKSYKTIEEQLEILKRRNLSIPDEQYAANYLLMNNYYNVVNYCSKPFEKALNCSDFFNKAPTSSYILGTTFDEIKSVHCFDKEIKSTIFKYSISCEQHLRSVVSHIFCKHHKEPYACLNVNNYDFSTNNIMAISNLISTLSKTINKHSKEDDDNAIKHYINGHGDVPLWVLSNCLDFGTIISIYRLLKRNERKEVRLEFEKSLKTATGDSRSELKPNAFITTISNIHSLRNVVAHNGKLFNFKARETPENIVGLHDSYNLNMNSKQDVFSTVIGMACFLSKK